MRAVRVLALIFVVGSPAPGQQPSPPIGALEHTVWTAQDGAPVGIRALAQSADGLLWIETASGLYRFDGVRFEPISRDSAGVTAEQLRAAGASLVDRRGNTWVVGPSGLVRVPPETRRGDAGRSSLTTKRQLAETVSLSTGSPGPPAFEDREGNVWVATSGGIERFRETKLTPVLLPASLFAPSLAPAADSSVWLGSQSHPLLAVVGDRVLTNGDVPTGVTSAYRDLRGSVWLGGSSGMWHAPAGASASSASFTPVALPDESGSGDVQAITRTLAGELWVSIRGGRRNGVFRRRGGDWLPVRLPPDLSGEIASPIVADSAGRVWLGLGNSLAAAAGDSIHLYSDVDGLRVGAISALLVRGPRVWIGGEFGLTMLADGRFQRVNATESLAGITGIVETADGDLWLNGAAGVTHIDAGEVRRALDSSAYRARSERFDQRDGLRGSTSDPRPLPTAIQGTDGRLWFTTTTGVAWLDPTRIKRNSVAPSVFISALTAGGKDYRSSAPVTLPPRTQALRVAYGALSFTIPDRVRFRYRLAGIDTNWVDAGTRREALYTNLDPGSYRFQVIAANEDNVWNEAGATVSVEIPRAFTQTTAFFVLVAVAAGCGLWLLALQRRRRVVGTPAAPLVGTRRPRPAERTQPEKLPALHELLSNAATQTLASTGITAHVEPVGSPRPYPPNVESEIVRIATEAMTNARQHTSCRMVTITCGYAPRELRVRVHDDGRGYDLTHGAPPSHWDLAGMRGRAASIGAQFSVESSPGAGTEVVLVVPGVPGRWTWWNKAVPSTET
jgi:hypothetical protein